jgi:hypothetical protein
MLYPVCSPDADTEDSLNTELGNGMIFFFGLSSWATQTRLVVSCGKCTVDDVGSTRPDE